MLSAEQRSLRAKLAAHAMHAQHDSQGVTTNARATFMGSFERTVIEQAEANGEQLTDAEVAKRAEHLRKAHMYRLALASAKARRKRAAEA